MNWFLNSNSTWARIARTVAQAILSFLMSYLPEIVGLFELNELVQALLIAVGMAILSPLMSELGKYVDAKIMASSGRRRFSRA